jgi:predicted dehydrogenase
MSKPLRIGIVGAGRVSQIAHLAHYVSQTNVELALSDIRPQLLQQVASHFGISRTFPDHRAMIAAGVDAIVVVVGRRATGPIVLDALLAGIDVLSEKPMALSYSESRVLVEAAQSERRRYAVAYMKRYDPAVEIFRRRFLDRLSDGGLGDFTGVHAWSCAGVDGSESADYIMTSEERPSGLVLWNSSPGWLPKSWGLRFEDTLNIHSHLTNLVRFVLGENLSCESMSRHNDVSRIAGRTPSGVLLSLKLCDGNRSDSWTEGIVLGFSHGELRIDMCAPFALNAAGAIIEKNHEGSTQVPVDGRAGAFETQARAFTAWLRGQTTFLSLGEDAIRDVEFAEDSWRRFTEAQDQIQGAGARVPQPRETNCTGETTALAYGLRGKPDAAHLVAPIAAHPD